MQNAVVMPWSVNCFLNARHQDAAVCFAGRHCTSHSLCHLRTGPVRHLRVKMAHELGVIQCRVVRSTLQAHGKADLLRKGLGARATAKGGHMIVQSVCLVQKLLSGQAAEGFQHCRTCDEQDERSWPATGKLTITMWLQAHYAVAARAVREREQGHGLFD